MYIGTTLSKEQLSSLDLHARVVTAETLDPTEQWAQIRWGLRGQHHGRVLETVVDNVLDANKVFGLATLNGIREDNVRLSGRGDLDQQTVVGYAFKTVGSLLALGPAIGLDLQVVEKYTGLWMPAIIFNDIWDRYGIPPVMAQMVMHDDIWLRKLGEDIDTVGSDYLRGQAEAHRRVGDSKWMNRLKSFVKMGDMFPGVADYFRYRLYASSLAVALGGEDVETGEKIVIPAV